MTVKILKIALVVLVVCILAGAAIGATVAYFTDHKQTENVFTAGEVKIRLTELDENGEVRDITNANARIDYGTVYPGREIKKQSTVIVEGTEAAYLAAKIVVEDGDRDINSILSLPGSGASGTTLDKFFVGGAWEEAHTLNENWQGLNIRVYENDSYVVFYDAAVTDGFEIYVLAKNVQNVDSEATFLGSFRFPVEWDAYELVQCGQLKINVSVFATQAAGFDSCYEAMRASFPPQFEAFK